MYCHLNQRSRIIIAKARQENHSLRQISRLIGCCASSISRELKRNQLPNGEYNAHRAQISAKNRSQIPRYQKIPPSHWKQIKKQLHQGNTPEQISQRAKYEGRFTISQEAIYQHIYKQAHQGDKSYQQLPRAKCKRSSRTGRKKRNTWIESKKQRRIELRPREAQDRSHIGHREADLVVGHRGSGYLLTLVERKTLYAKVDKIKQATKEQVLSSLAGMLAELPASLKKSITFDNGIQFLDARRIEKETKTKVYYAHPYHSWERGTNEHFNGLLRRDYPKEKPFSHITERKAVLMETKWNNIPRKSLNWLTPAEAVCLELERKNQQQTTHKGIRETKGLNLRIDYLNIPEHTELQAIVAKRIKHLLV